MMSEISSLSSQQAITPTRVPASVNEVQPLVNSTPSSSQDGDLTKTETTFNGTRKRWHSRRRIIVLLVIAIAISLFLAIFLPVFFVVVKRPHSAGSTGIGSSGDGGGSSSNTPSGSVTTGGDGSVVTMDNGTTFVYQNSFGGYWVQDPQNPFNNNARPNSWTPPLNTSWQWGKDRVYGVNLGGLFVIEPFISPSLFQQYPAAMDEYTLSQAMTADEANGGLKQLEDHYATFITEQDIAEIAGAGLNWIRIPLAFWAIETWPGEPYLAKTSWTYFLRVVEWARKYGLRICLDFHAVPGSQNGYNHSGRLSPINFLSGNMGIANAQRTLYYLRVLTEFISQPQYRDVIQVIELVNEPLAGALGTAPLTSFYVQAHAMIRSITGTGTGNGPYIAISDGLQPLSSWDGLLPGSDRVMLDGHPYFAFGGVNTAPIATTADDGLPGGTWPRSACDNWGPSFNQSRENTGVTIGGEFSAAPNDCGLYVRGVGDESTNPQCPEYDNWENYNDTMKAGIQSFVMASFDALGDFFYWTWKIGPSQDGRVSAPLWSYKLGLDNGWIPKDPRTSIGKCQALGAAAEPFDGNYQPWQTGTPSSIPAAYTQEFPWPPASITGVVVAMSLLPTYTNTAPITTLPVPTFTSAPSSVTKSLDGWFNDNDTDGGITTVAGCTYPDEYFGVFSVTPTAPCTGPTST